MVFFWGLGGECQGFESSSILFLGVLEVIFRVSFWGFQGFGGDVIILGKGTCHLSMLMSACV